MTHLRWMVALMLLSACTTINPGYVGIKVNKFGANRGVSDYTITTGFVSYNPMTTSVFEWPTFVQTAMWTANPKEGRSERNDEITFNSKEGLTISADVSLSYQLEPVKVPHFYVQFRTDDMDAFTHGFLRNVARDAFNEEGAKYSVEEIYSTQKETMLTNVKTTGEANANAKLAASLSSNLLEWRRLDIQQQAITKWDGALPQVSGQATPFITLPAPKAP